MAISSGDCSHHGQGGQELTTMMRGRRGWWKCSLAIALAMTLGLVGRWSLGDEPPRTDPPTRAAAEPEPAIAPVPAATAPTATDPNGPATKADSTGATYFNASTAG